MNKNNMPDNLYTGKQVSELDRRAIEDRGIDAYTLMQRAGKSAFDLLQERWPQTTNIWVLCGSGNNGGDGLVVARLARDAGLNEQVLLLPEPQRLSGAAKQALDDYKGAGGEPLALSNEVMERLFREADVVVDALLGTGLDRPVEGDCHRLIEVLHHIAARKVAIVSLDLPSGLHADTGEVMGSAVQADATISFIGLKLGLVTGAGPYYAGDLFFNDLSVPADIYKDLEPRARRITDGLRRKCLKPRNRVAHKGQHGRVLCVGGDYGMGGAIRLAAEAAIRSGSGLVSVATRPEIAASLSQARPELMASGLADGQAVIEMAEKADVLVLGPGLGQGAWGRSLWTRSLTIERPLVMDADGLNFLAGDSRKRDYWILTPHPGEAARLLGTKTAAIQADRPAAVDALLEKFGGTVVLKGPGTLVKTEGGVLHVCTEGNPGMAVGGMGDLLSGIIAALLAQGLTAENAACLAVYIHSRAADEAAAKLGQRGLLPSDLWPWLRRLLNP